MQITIKPLDVLSSQNRSKLIPLPRKLHLNTLRLVLSELILEHHIKLAILLPERHIKVKSPLELELIVIVVPVTERHLSLIDNPKMRRKPIYKVSIVRDKEYRSRILSQ